MVPIRWILASRTEDCTGCRCVPTIRPAALVCQSWCRSGACESQPHLLCGGRPDVCPERRPGAPPCGLRPAHNRLRCLPIISCLNNTEHSCVLAHDSLTYYA